MAIGLRYQALANKQIDVVNGYATDGMISALKLKRLKDDQNLWPPYYVVPVVRKEALDANPKIAEVLNRVSAMLDEASIAEHELQGRRRQDGAARRRARLPEGQGRRPLTLSVAARAQALPMTLAVGATASRSPTSSPSRATTRRSRSPPRRARASPRRAQSSSGWPPATRRSTASTRRSAPTPARRSPPATSPRTSARGPGARRRRRAAPTTATSCARCCSRASAAWRRAAPACRPPCSTRSSRCSIAASIRRCRASARSASPILPQLSHLALPLIGEGEAEFGGTVMTRRRGACAAPASRR